MIARTICVVLLPFVPLASFAQACPILNGLNSGGDLQTLSDEEVQCSVSRVLGGGRSEDCFWRFQFRSDAARQHFESLKREMKNCSDGPLQVEASDVNHPDSFEQITADVRGISMSLSLKDKGGLSETLVVLRRTLP